MTTVAVKTPIQKLHADSVEFWTKQAKTAEANVIEFRKVRDIREWWEHDAAYCNAMADYHRSEGKAPHPIRSDYHTS